MSLSLSNLNVVAGAKTRIANGTLSFDSSYPTGGEPLTKAQLGLSSLTSFEVLGNPSGYLFQYDEANSKLKVFTAPGVEVANATDLSALTNLDFEAVGL